MSGTSGQKLKPHNQVSDDLNKVIEIMLLFLTYSDAYYKQVTFWTKGDKTKTLINIMKGPIFNQNVPEHKTVLSKNVRFARILLQCFIVAATLTCFLWILFPIIMFVQGKPVEFMIWLPFNTNTGLRFTMAVIYMWLQNTYMAINNITLDAYIDFLLQQAKTQLCILREDIIKLVQRSKDEAKNCSKPYPVVVQKRFRQILLHYNEVVKFFDIVQSTFSGPLLYQFLISGWIICTTAYKTININPASLEFISMGLYLICIVLEIFLFCHFGHEVNWESASIIDSAYISDWMQLPMSQRKELILFMERLKRPLEPKAGGIIPLSNTTFISIMRSSYSFYVLLKSSS